VLEETLAKIKREVGSLLTQESISKHFVRRSLVYFVRLGTYFTLEFNQNQCLQKAAALAYTTILSLVPVTALLVLYTKVAGKLDAFSVNIQEWILRSFVAESAQGVIVYIDQFIANLHTRTLGTIGVGGLIFTAYSLLRTVEKSLNSIWKVRTHRTIWARFQMLCSLLIVVPTFLAASLYISGKVNEFKFFDTYAELTAIMRTTLVTVPFFLTCASLFFVFKLVPNTWVKWKAAIISAIFAAFLFETAKLGFNLYVLKVIPVSKIYGSLGLVPVLLLWIYFSWVIVFFGVELGYTIQNLKVLHEQMLQKHLSDSFGLTVHEDWGLKIAETLAKRFIQGKGPQNANIIAKDISLPVPVVEDHLTILKQAKLLVWVENEDFSGFVFGKPVEKILVGDVLSVFRTHLGLPRRKTEEDNKTLFEKGS